jgi:hypothetical protein
VIAPLIAPVIAPVIAPLIAPVSRRRALRLAALLLVAGCSETPPPVFERLDFDYLTKIRLDVGRVDIDDSWVPSGRARQLGYLAPVRPEAALRSMAESRLVPGSTQGRATFVVDNASIIQDHSTFAGDFAVHLDIFGADDQRAGTVAARVRATRKATDDEDENAVRTDLDALVRKMMSDMNVEFEFQLRKALRERVQTTSPDAPAPAPVETQDLDAPTAPKP